MILVQKKPACGNTYLLSNIAIETVICGFWLDKVSSWLVEWYKSCSFDQGHSIFGCFIKY